jgi:hypothetical protein
VAADLCGLPTNAQQASVLGSVDPSGGAPRFDAGLPDCSFIGGDGELILEVDRDVPAEALQQHLSEMSSGSHCIRTATKAGEARFHCAGHLPADMDHRPELVAVTFRGRTVAGAVWLGDGEGQALPRDEGAKFDGLQGLSAEIARKYASS